MVTTGALGMAAGMVTDGIIVPRLGAAGTTGMGGTMLVALGSVGARSPSLPMRPDFAESRSLSIGRRSVLPTVGFLIGPWSAKTAAAAG
jgi:hypothetical protein